VARLYYNKGQFNDAKQACQRALAIQEKALGIAHRLTAASLNNLALIHERMGDKETAIRLYRQTILARETALGPTHPDLCRPLYNLAELYSHPEPLIVRTLGLPVTLRQTSGWDEDGPQVVLWGDFDEIPMARRRTDAGTLPFAFSYVRFTKEMKDGAIGSSKEPVRFA
jgi:tetratricopeptide (TPR) repeat protein